MKITSVKLRVLKKLKSEQITLVELAREIGVTKSSVSDVLNGERFTRSVQEKIAERVGMRLGLLFGGWAWFRVAARKLAKMRNLKAG